MSCDAVGTGEDRSVCSPNGVRMQAATRIADRGHVINIHAEARQP
jgi:hypothetical protein